MGVYLEIVVATDLQNSLTIKSCQLLKVWSCSLAPSLLLSLSDDCSNVCVVYLALVVMSDVNPFVMVALAGMSNMTGAIASQLQPCQAEPINSPLA